MPEISARSALVWGRNSPIRRGMVKIALEELGIFNGHLFRPPTRGWALRESIKQVAREFPVSGTLEIRPLETPLAYEAVRVRKGESQNREQFLFSAMMAGNAPQVLCLHHRHRDMSVEALHGKLREQIEIRLTWLNPAQVRNLVDRIVVGHLGGVRLGGVNTFYLPPQSVDRFEGFKARAALTCYGLTKFAVSTDPDTVASVIQALRDEIADGIKAIEASLSGAEVTRSQALSVQEKARLLESKVRLYEAALGTALPEVKESIGQAVSSAAIAGLLAASV